MEAPMWLAHFKYMTDSQLMEFTNRLAVDMLAAAKQRKLTSLIPNLVGIIDSTKHAIEKTDGPANSNGWPTGTEARF